MRPGAGRSPGRAPGREDRRILVTQRDVVELVKNLHNLLFTMFLAGGQPLGSLQILQPAQALHLADHYLPSFRLWRAIFVPQSLGARIVPSQNVAPTGVSAPRYLTPGPLAPSCPHGQRADRHFSPSFSPKRELPIPYSLGTEAADHPPGFATSGEIVGETGPPKCRFDRCRTTQYRLA